MVWIKTIPETEATGALAHAYRRQAAVQDYSSDFILLGSLDPNLVAARLELHRASERCPSPLTQRQRLIIAYVTSVLNDAPHCGSQIRLKLRHAGVSDPIIGALEQGHYDLAPAEAAVASYAHQLTTDPDAIGQGLVQALREVGLDDLAILDANNLCAYLNYLNRVANGLGLHDEVLTDLPAVATVPNQS